MIPVHVECYSGHTYAQEPRAIVWRGFRAAIVRIEFMSRTPEGPVFRVRLDDGALIDLHYVEARDEWLVTDQLLPRL